VFVARGTQLGDAVNRWGFPEPLVVYCASCLAGGQLAAACSRSMPPNSELSLTPLPPFCSVSPFDRLFSVPPANGWGYTHKEVRLSISALLLELLDFVQPDANVCLEGSL